MATIALFIPCYNEAKRLNVSAFNEFIHSHLGFIDFYFIDDGSQDNTSEIIEKNLLIPNSSFIISTGKNLGKGNALILGISQVDTDKYDYVAFIDSDGDIPLDQVLKLYEQIKQEDAQFAISNRNFFNDFQFYSLRSYTSVLMVYLANVLIGYEVGLKDTQCGCKMFRANLVQYCFKKNFVSEWLFDIEMFIRFKQQFTDSRPSIVEVPIKSTLNTKKSRSKLFSIHKILHQLYQIKCNYR